MCCHTDDKHEHAHDITASPTSTSIFMMQSISTSISAAING